LAQLGAHALGAFKRVNLANRPEEEASQINVDGHLICDQRNTSLLLEADNTKAFAELVNLVDEGEDDDDDISACEFIRRKANLSSMSNTIDDGHVEDVQLVLPPSLRSIRPDEIGSFRKVPVYHKLGTQVETQALENAS